MAKMQTYIEIEVPLRQSARWLGDLKQVMRENYLPVRWQNGYYHITLAFLNPVPSGVDVSAIMKRHLASFEAPSLTFDRLDAFAKRSGGGVVFLTCSDLPGEFLSITESLRKDLEDAGCVIESDFKLHVTLGRVDRDVRVAEKKLQELLSEVDVPSFSLQLKKVNYREFRGRTLCSLDLKGNAQTGD